MEEAHLCHSKTKYHRFVHSRGIEKSQGVWSLSTHGLLQTDLHTQHHENRHLSGGAHQDSEAPERMLLVEDSERTNTGDERGRTMCSDLGPNWLLEVNHISCAQFGHSQHLQYPSLVGK